MPGIHASADAELRLVGFEMVEWQQRLVEEGKARKILESTAGRLILVRCIDYQLEVCNSSYCLLAHKYMHTAAFPALPNQLVEIMEIGDWKLQKGQIPLRALMDMSNVSKCRVCVDCWPPPPPGPRPWATNSKSKQSD